MFTRDLANKAKKKANDSKKKNVITCK